MKKIYESYKEAAKVIIDYVEDLPRWLRSVVKTTWVAFIVTIFVLFMILPYTIIVNILGFSDGWGVLGCVFMFFYVFMYMIVYDRI